MSSTSRFPVAKFIAPRYWVTWCGLGLSWLLVQLPYRWQMVMGKLLGRVLYYTVKSRRNIARVNLELCFPGMSARDRKKLLKQHFESLGMSAFETAICWWWPKSRLMTLCKIEGLEYVKEAIKNGKGAIMLDGHFTTVEIGATLLGLHISTNAMYKKLKNELIDTVMIRARNQHSVGENIPYNDVRATIRSLRKNYAVWYAPDQDFGIKHSVFVPFFGIPAATLTATSRFSKITSAPVIPFFQERLRDGSGYQLRFQAPLKEFPSGNDMDDAARVNKIIENEIIKYPEQYLWIHRRFKTRPDGMPYLYINETRKLSLQRYNNILAVANVIEHDMHGPKVIRMPDNVIVKIFRLKRLFSSAQLWPYAKRFRDNSWKLRELGIPTVSVKNMFYCKEAKRHLVSYPMIEGQTLRSIAEKEKDNHELIARLIDFIVLLHYKGVFFRSLHMGNIIIQPDNSFALIDIADMRIKKRPLSIKKRARNFNHLLRYDVERHLIGEYGLTRFFNEYVSLAGLSPLQQKFFMLYIRQQMPDEKL